MTAVCLATVCTGDLLAPFDWESEGRNGQGCTAVPVCWPAARVLYEAIRASTFTGYFIVLFCVRVSYHICDCGNLKVSLSPDVRVKWPYA